MSHISAVPASAPSPISSARTVLISSLGLMGGSLAAALSHAGWDVRLHHRRFEVARDAESRGYGRAVKDLAAGIDGCDCAVICAPVSVIPRLSAEIAALSDTCTITDVGSTKTQICEELGTLYRSGRFIGSHPMAGSHLQGLANADATLFQGANCAITAHPDAPAYARTRIADMWQAVGGTVHYYTPSDHDQAVAEVSHLPHILSSAVAMAFSERGAPLAASGFRDTTRVAAGSASLWRDILMQNHDAVCYQLTRSVDDIHRLLSAMHSADPAAIEAWLQEGCDGRARFEQHRPPQDNSSSESTRT